MNNTSWRRRENKLHPLCSRPRVPSVTESAGRECRANALSAIDAPPHWRVGLRKIAPLSQHPHTGVTFSDGRANISVARYSAIRSPVDSECFGDKADDETLAKRDNRNRSRPWHVVQFPVGRGSDETAMVSPIHNLSHHADHARGRGNGWRPRDIAG